MVCAHCWNCSNHRFSGLVVLINQWLISLHRGFLCELLSLSQEKQFILSTSSWNSETRLLSIQTRETNRIGHVTRGNFSCNLSRNDDDWKTLQVAEGVSHVRNIFSRLVTLPLEIVYNSFSASLKSLPSKSRALIAHFSQNCVVGCNGHVKRSNLFRNVAKS